MLSERRIEREWVELTVTAPDSIEPDPKGPNVFRGYRRIPEHGGRLLRVVYVLAGDSARVLTAFFDRRHKP
jgi:hypothetical protein